MEQYISKSALVAEIEKLFEKGKCHEEYDCGYRDGRNGVLYELQGKIDTIEVKEVDLEKEMKAFAVVELEPLNIYDANIGISITMHQLYKCAEHFFKIGLKYRKD